jgi:hypothetical protein
MNMDDKSERTWARMWPITRTIIVCAGGTEERYGKNQSINQDSQFSGRYLTPKLPKHGPLTTTLQCPARRMILDEVHRSSQ